MKHREFVYVGDPVPELNEQEHAAFLMNIQRSLLLSLEQRNLLTSHQRERCITELMKKTISLGIPLACQTENMSSEPVRSIKITIRVTHILLNMFLIIQHRQSQI